jgi:DNA-binding transcriptional regulator GbsR (MarR family)
MYQDIKPAILEQLRHGPLTLVEIAEATGEAQFLVRTELKSLQRDRLVIDKFEHAGQQVHVFELTDRGVKRANAGDQLELA